MGTNYYVKYNQCNHCGRYDEEHIGKSSFGWTFTFHATDKIRSWKDWKDFLTTGIKIFDEYGTEIDILDFVSLVDKKQSEKHNHAREYPEGSFLDNEGNSMSEGEFS